jgi:Flp pilus assembly protein TadG
MFRAQTARGAAAPLRAAPKVSRNPFRNGRGAVPDEGQTGGKAGPQSHRPATGELPGCREILSSNRSRARSNHRRRGVTAVLIVLLLIVFFAMVAFAIDVGYMALTRTQLQAAADSAALAAASVLAAAPDTCYEVAADYADDHRAGGASVHLDEADVVIGLWDPDNRTFTPGTNFDGNAVRVTARRVDVPLFFGPVLGRKLFSAQASTVSMTNPRDICFVVDLSGSMNDDTEPAWVSDHLNSEYSEYGSVGDDLMQAVFDDFDFGNYPGTLEYLGSTLGVAQDQFAYANMTKNGGPLTGGSIPPAYKILSGDSESTRKRKCYSWIMDTRFPVIMPDAQPTPNSTNTTSYAYWERYIDYVVRQANVSGRGTIPSLVNSTYRVTGLNNPNTANYPVLTSSVPQGFRNKLGYRTYVSFMMDYGRDVTVASGQYTPLSINSPLCPYHSETVGDKTFNFPPREQPTHATRRSLIAAMQVIRDENEFISDLNARDWVSIITFDHLSGSGPQIIQPLTGDYDLAMEACRTLQAVCDDKSSTATEAGLIKALAHLTTKGQGGPDAASRRNAHRVVILVTDGVPNLYQSSNADIDDFIGDNASSNFYSGGPYAKNAPLMQAMNIQMKKWYFYPVGLGLGTDYDFMDRMARMGKTANEDGEAFRSSGNPTEYEAVLTDIFEKIIKTPRPLIVQ